MIIQLDKININAIFGIGDVTKISILEKYINKDKIIFDDSLSCEKYDLDFNFIYLNIKNNELKELKILLEKINNIEYIYLDFKDTIIDELDNNLEKYKRVITIKNNEKTGETLYIKTGLVEKNSVIFKCMGRLGNAIFRYFAMALFCIKNDFDYFLDNEFNKKIEKYNFYPGVDFPDNNVEKINPSDIFNKTNNDNILCFNTYGYLKNNFNSNNLTYLNDKNQGLYVKNILKITDKNYLDFFNNNLSHAHLLFEGYFQFDIYLPYKKKILEFMELHKNEHYIRVDGNDNYLIKDIIDEIELPSSKIYDIVIHLRLTDFQNRPDFIEYEYYEKLFEMMNFSRKSVCIVVEKNLKKSDKIFLNNCINWFKKRKINCVIESNDLLIDFNIMKQCKVLVCSMSTLSWCAAFLSKKIEICYMPNYNFTKIRPITSFKNPIRGTIFYDVSSTKKKKNRV